MDAKSIAQALGQCDWTNNSIGNKALVKAAVEELQRLSDLNAEMLAALLAAVECGMVPTSSATEGGAMKYVKQARVADQIRAAIKKAEGGKA